MSIGYQTMYTHYIESLTKEQRSRQGSLSDIISGFVPCLYSVVGYSCRDWRMQLYVIGALNAISMLWLWFLPESKKWLATQVQETKETPDKIERITSALRNNVAQFKMIVNSGPVLRVCLIMVSPRSLQ